MTRVRLPRHAAASACAALCAFLVGAAPSPASAQPAPSTATASAGPPIVVTGTRVPQRVDQALAEVTVVDRAQIEAAGSRTLTELLALQPGLQSWATGGEGKATSVSMRGLEARHTLLLVDGVRLGSATLGLPSFESLPLESIERIEIVRGPLSALYGSDAVGGVVQVFTRRGAPGLQPAALAEAGSDGRRVLGAALRAGTAGSAAASPGAVDLALQARALRSDGFSATNPRVPFGAFNPDRDGLDQDSASLRLGLALPAQWRAEARALHSRGESRFDDGPGADARTGLLAEVLALQLSGPVTAQWRSSLQLSRSRDELDTRATASAFTPLGVTATTQRQLAWEHTLATRAGTLLLLAERVEQQVTRPGAAFAVSARTIDAFAAGLAGSAGVHHWQAALRRDRNSQFGRPGTGSVAWGIDLTPAWRATLSAGTSFVAPSFNQLYFPNFGNPRLLPERGRHAEAALQWRGEGQALRAAWFGHRIRGYISSGPLPANLPRTVVEGLALSWDGSAGPWQLSASGEFLDPRNRSAGTANFGRLLPRRAEQTLRLSAERGWAGWTVAGTLRAVGPRFDDPANALPLAGFVVLDLGLQRQIAPGLRLALKLDNAADQRHETVYGYNSPQRRWLATLRWGGE
jgi:vitamin B12 transporter